MERLQAIEGLQLLGQPKDRFAVISFVAERQKPKETEKLLDERGVALGAGELAAEPLLTFFGVEKAV